jgi:enamine deaminase RidA (YjgF/YER057c/UK114 family)
MGGVERHGSGGPFEARVGYSRVIRAGELVVVAGTTALMPDGVIAGIGDPYLQAQQTLENVASALARVGASLADVIRTRVFLIDTGHFDGFARAHGEAFGDIRPVNTTVVVAELADPRMLIEIEVDAWMPAGAGAGVGA